MHKKSMWKCESESRSAQNSFPIFQCHQNFQFQHFKIIYFPRKKLICHSFHFFHFFNIDSFQKEFDEFKKTYYIKKYISKIEKLITSLKINKWVLGMLSCLFPKLFSRRTVLNQRNIQTPKFPMVHFHCCSLPLLLLLLADHHHHPLHHHHHLCHIDQGFHHHHHHCHLR